jgi:hypothetical protein
MLAAEVVDGAAGIVLALFGIEFNTQDLIRGDHFRGVTKMVSSQLNTARNRTLLQRCDAVAEFEDASASVTGYISGVFPLTWRGFVWRGHGVT